MYAQQQIYLTWGGTMPALAGQTGKEVWQCGVRFSAIGGAGSPSAGFQAFSLDDVAADIQAWYQNSNMHIASDVQLSWVKAALLRVDGVYAEDARIFSYLPALQGGGGSAALTPLQCSLVVTLASGQTTGRANYGRFYLPPMSVVRDYGQGTISSSYTAQIASQTTAMLQAVDGEISTLEHDWQLSIMSSLGNGLTKPVAEIRVGNVMDTQRRRRNAIDESYSITAYTQQGP